MNEAQACLEAVELLAPFDQGKMAWLTAIIYQLHSLRKACYDPPYPAQSPRQASIRHS
jgi:hypothetical protein